ncbi:hypothetical protein DID77_02915, partial [Candidatus Marinamargulisbacteria bacterium SCGC AG-439-L15]
VNFDGLPNYTINSSFKRVIVHNTDSNNNQNRVDQRPVFAPFWDTYENHFLGIGTNSPIRPIDINVSTARNTNLDPLFSAYGPNTPNVMTILPNASVGIATANPIAKLSITNVDDPPKNLLFINHNGSFPFSISSDGNLGINTYDAPLGGPVIWVDTFNYPEHMDLNVVGTINASEKFILGHISSENRAIMMGPRIALDAENYLSFTDPSNVKIGAYTAGLNFSGTRNILVGYNIASTNSTIFLSNLGHRNIIIGNDAAPNLAGHNNIIIGSRSGNPAFTTMSDNILIGRDIISSVTENGKLIIEQNGQTLIYGDFSTSRLSIGGTSLPTRNGIKVIGKIESIGTAPYTGIKFPDGTSQTKYEFGVEDPMWVPTTQNGQPFLYFDRGMVMIGTGNILAGLHLAHNEGVLSTGSMGSGTALNLGSETRFHWYPKKAAFRAGSSGGTAWDHNTIGDYSVAFGEATSAQGLIAAALGYNVESNYNELAIGQFNIGGGNTNIWFPTDSIFQIGVGTSSSNKKNAVTVLKNGKVGIGTPAPNLNYLVDVNGTINVSALETNLGIILSSYFSNGNSILKPQTLDTPSSQTDFLFGSTQLDDIAGTSDDKRLFFDKSKGAFRAGEPRWSPGWDDVHIGSHSVAFGRVLSVRSAYSNISGGLTNVIADPSSEGTVIAGGEHIYISSTSNYSYVGGGYMISFNSSSYLSILGGENQSLSLADHSVILGGSYNEIRANYALAAGRRAHSLHQGTFVWADSQNSDFSSTANINQFLIRSENGVAINTANVEGYALSVDSTINAAELHIGGNPKTFIIEHPINSEKNLVHATLEGPEAAVYYRGTSQLKKGKAIVKLPDYFKELVDANSISIKLTCINSWSPLSSHYPKKSNKFTVSTSKTGNSKQQFHWIVHATRKDIPNLTVEPLKSLLNVKSRGPYTYAETY